MDLSDPDLLTPDTSSWTAIKLLPEDQSGAKVINLPLIGKDVGTWGQAFDSSIQRQPYLIPLKIAESKA